VREINTERKKKKTGKGFVRASSDYRTVQKYNRTVDR